MNGVRMLVGVSVETPSTYTGGCDRSSVSGHFSQATSLLIRTLFLGHFLLIRTLSLY